MIARHNEGLRHLQERLLNLHKSQWRRFTNNNATLDHPTDHTVVPHQILPRTCPHPPCICTSHTSRKQCEKEPRSFSHCGSFDHPDMQSLNDCKFFIFVLRMKLLKFGGHVIHCWKGIFKTFRVVY
jgi:hypothetical protein